ncbi:unnamed protein product [Acanthoscelides obtectus]|uniref:Uncharacterized protein n=1 Tax=Acanthoscelides obtectus TaxID=200917 RepID=A0A9P0PTG7_ACAOB|nr:unnamed protein product [Acanthoscelides obtectus]CAK1657189.1 hypothetical protein AOBTE_LOCUS20189 [Acanthoscelides obtectus]
MAKTGRVNFDLEQLYVEEYMDVLMYYKCCRLGRTALFLMQRTDDSEVVFNNGKWSSYTQQLKRPKTRKLSCTKTVQNKKYISVNYGRKAEFCETTKRKIH